MPMAQWVLDRRITSVGTLQSNRKGIPAEIKELKDRETNSYTIYWEKDNGILTMHSYVVKTKSSGKRNVLFLATLPPLFATTKNDNKSKSAIYTLYDFSKGRTDIIDQKMGFYSCKSKSKRWTMKAFLYVLDTCQVNPSTIYAINNDLQPRNIKSLDFGFELACL